MLPVIWLDDAKADVRRVIAYIARENPQAARRLRKVLEDAVSPVAEHPYLYRPSERFPGTREIVATPNYVIFYRVAASRIEVVNVVHSRREFP